jgi:uncharacterized protein (DUF952 family)/GNAT superfamily N-acetyltransferase
VPARVLLHLIEPARWRAALDDGAVRPPSLDDVGFVHLSTPDQVHLPAAALFPGRRDLVLLEIDPDRLSDPVRFEPGMPDDPAGMRFPHLYGPLPVTAVIAVVPYRPPSPFQLPAPDDRFGRALAHTVSLHLRRAVGVGDVPGGVAILDPDVPHSRDNNRLVLTEPVDAGIVEAAVAEVAGNAGWPYQTAALLWPGSGEVAVQLRARGWKADEFVHLARTPARMPVDDRVEVVAQEAVHEFWERSWRQVLPLTGAKLNRVVAELIARERLNDQVVAVTDLVIREKGRIVASGQLRIDGATAAVDSVLTDPAARGRGHADEILARALDLAAVRGCDLVVLEAVAADWPRHWYVRRGFEQVGSVWEVVRPA